MHIFAMGSEEWPYVQSSSENMALKNHIDISRTSEGIRQKVHDTRIRAWLGRAFVALRLVEQYVGETVVLPLLILHGELHAVLQNN